MSIKRDGTFRTRGDSPEKFNLVHSEIISKIKYHHLRGFTNESDLPNDFEIKDKYIRYKGYKYNKATFIFFLVMGKWPYGITSYLDGNSNNIRWSNLYNSHHKDEMDIKLRQFNGENVVYIDPKPIGPKQIQLKAQKKEKGINHTKFKAQYEYDAGKGRLINKDSPNNRCEFFSDLHNTLVIYVQKRMYKLSELIIYWHYGSFPQTKPLHINGDKTDFRIENLECEFHNQYESNLDSKFIFNEENKKIIDEYEARIKKEMECSDESNRAVLRNKLITFKRQRMIRQSMEETRALFRSIGY